LVCLDQEKSGNPVDNGSYYLGAINGLSSCSESLGQSPLNL
jgi:hypothetical protein